MVKKCTFCNRDDVKLFMSFGKWKCRECIDKRKTGRAGHSGMVYDKEIKPSDYKVNSKGLCLVSVKKSHPLLVKWYIEHYPGSKGIVGRSLNYLIYVDEFPIGIISVASPPRNYKIFRKIFSVEDDLQFVNNNVFRIVEKHEPNVGTQILKLLRRRVGKDYKVKYGQNLLGICTFVEPPRTGAIYKADNWKYLGLTQGVEVRRRGTDWFEKTYTKGVKKHIYAIGIDGFKLKEI